MLFATVILVGLPGGVAMSFFGNELMRRRLIYVLTFGPVTLTATLLILVSGLANSLPALSIVGAGICATYIFFWLGKTLGKPFAEIRQERAERTLADEFR